MKRCFNRLARTGGASLFLCLAFLFQGQLLAASQFLRGHVPAVTANLTPVGSLADTNRLKLSIGLPLRNTPALTNLLQQIYDPKSPNYHHYLTVSQFAENFGPTAADYQGVRDFVRSNGLAESGIYANRMVVSVEASVADIRRVFHVNLRTYNHPTENRTFYAPDTEPSLDLSIPILHIAGLDSYVLPHSFSHKKPGASGKLGEAGTNATSLNGSGPGGNLLGNDFRVSYAPGVSLTGQGQNCALFEYDGYYPSDITAYEQLAGLPSVNLVNVPVDGGIVGPPGGGVSEVSLDIEMVASMAPGISTLYVYESPGGPCDDVFSRMASDNSSKQISSSWGFQTDPTSEQLFQEFGMQGQSFYQASGDSDAYVGVISTPEDDPNITLVGGTELVMNGVGASYASESVWNWGYQPPGGAPQFMNYWGSGGGISTVWPIPSWQQGVNMTLPQGSSTFRNTPDVAMPADNIWVIAGDNTQTGSYGGTSCAAPLWCGFTALVNQQAAYGGSGSVGFINPAVYAIGESAKYTSCFHDTTVGNNFWPSSATLFAAVTGYDLCTGWGSPTGQNLINALAPVPSVPVLVVLTNIISGGNGNGIIDYDECNNLTIILTNLSPIGATGIETTLTSTTPGAIVAQGVSAYPSIAGSNAAVNSTLFTLSTTPSFVCGTPVNLTLVVKSTQTIQTNYITLPSGVLGTPDTFSSSTVFSIPNTNPTPVYSPIAVSGLQTLGKLTVSVYVQALYDSGITMTLIAPNGTNVVLTQNNGGLGANFGSSCSSSSETTFDDSAPTSITVGAVPFVGSFAPQQPLSSLDLLSGTNLNGTWILAVSDEFPGDTASLDCWSLNISPEVCVDGGGQCPGSDLSITMSDSPNPVYEGSNLVYALTVSNAGPRTADSVLISQQLPAGMTFVAATNYPVTPSLSGSNLSLVVGTLQVYQTAVVDVVVTPSVPGLLTSTATVTSQESDPNPLNNSASASVLVTQPVADVGVTMTATPSSVLQNGTLTFTITVTNNGPFPANAVSLSTVLPTNANFLSATASQGTVQFNGTLATLGTIPVGTNVVVKISVSPTVTGTISATTTATISPLETDPIILNNTATASAIVGPAADLGVTAVAAPSPVVSGSNINYTITVTNMGPSAATNVVVNQSIPPGTAFLSTTMPGGGVSGGEFSGTIPSVASGGSFVLTNVVTAPTLLPGVQQQPLFSTIIVFGQPGDPNTNNNTVILETIVEPPVITIVGTGVTITSGSSNGSIGPSGTYGVKLYLQNVGTIPTTDLVATLLNSNGVTFSSGSQTYGVLAPGSAPAAGQYTFTANSTNGGTITADLQWQDGTNSGLVQFVFHMPIVQSFWNTNFISIPDPTNIPEPAYGWAKPYPSPIVVSNVSGTVASVAVTISNMVHSYPADVGMLLIGPTGQNCVIMSDAGQYSSMTTPTTITLSESASLVLPEMAGIVTGSYQPAEYNLTNAYPNSPLPMGPYNTNLGVFNSISANGTWSLYIYDDAAGDYGAVSNGWGLAITTITPATQLADLSAYITPPTNQTVLGNTVSAIWGITNYGPDPATVFVTNILSSGLSLVTNYLPSGAGVVQSGPTSIYNLGIFASGFGVLITNTIITTAQGTQTSVIAVGSPVLDGNPVNNTASAVVTVLAPPADLAVGPILASPSPAVTISNLVYTLYVTNNGPSNAFSVAGVFTNSPNVHAISAVPSQGTATVSATSVQCSLGTILPNQFAVVMITATPQSAGVVTNGWSVTTACNDTNLSNNSVTSTVTIVQPSAIITNGPVTLLSQYPGPYNGAINSGQTNTLSFALMNVGSGPTTNLVATLQASGGLTPLTSTGNYGAIQVQGSVTQTFSFIASGAAGSYVTATFSLKDGANTSFAPVTYRFMIPETVTLANTGAIIIPDSGPGNPYPSVIQVSSLTNGATNLLITKVTATLNGFSHSFPHDVEAILVSPAGQEVVLMEHTGGPYGVNNINLTFDDAASQHLAASNTLTSGTYLTTEYAPFDTFPGLAAIPATSTNLAYFNGMNPNGIWSLYVYDDTPGNDGAVSSGWSLAITGESPVNPASRLVVSTFETPSPAVGGNYVNYYITVSNAGPAIANGVYLTNVIPAGTALVPSATSLTQGSSSVSGGTVTCNLGTIAVGSTANATSTVIAGARGTITNTATAASTSTDLYAADAISVTTTTVGANAAPYLSAFTVGSGGFQLTVLGDGGQNYAVQFSTNLIQWTSISTNTGSFIYTDSNTNTPARFYRAVQLPQ